MPSVDINMNIYYMQQAQQYAMQRPHDQQAQRQAAYWAEVVARQSMANAQAQGATPAPQAVPGAQAQGPMTAPQQPMNPAAFMFSAPQANLPSVPLAVPGVPYRLRKCEQCIHQFDKYCD